MTTRLRTQAPGKVNLCLFLGPTRTDGRHELVTVFESVSLADELELTVLSGAGSDEVVCMGVEGPNLVADALVALREAGWAAPPVRIRITKQIPVAAGMGGGSADAAAALRLANAVEPLAEGVAIRVARNLGADVPGQLEPGLALGIGAGEIVQPLPPLEEHAFIVVPQPFGLSTPAVYAEADRLGLPRPSLDGLRERVLAAGKRLPDELMVNDLEPAALALAPSLAGTLERVRTSGAGHALVCGSGPTVIGVFWGADAASRAMRAADQVGGQAATPSPASVTIDGDR